MKQKPTIKPLVLQISFCLLAHAAHADDSFSYKYIELGVGHSNNTMKTRYNFEGRGYYFKGSFNLSESIYLGGYFDDKEINNLNFDVANYGIFSGYHKSLKPNLDIYGEVKAFRINPSNLGSRSNAMNLLGFGGGLRYKATEKFELGASYFFYNQNNSLNSNYNAFAVETSYEIFDNKSLRLKVESSDGELESQLGFRFSF